MNQKYIPDMSIKFNDGFYKKVKSMIVPRIYDLIKFSTKDSNKKISPSNLNTEHLAKCIVDCIDYTFANYSTIGDDLLYQLAQDMIHELRVKYRF